MYRPTSAQRQLWEKDALLDERSRRRLEGSWAESFQRRVLPVLLEEEEEIGPQLYADIGRPTWSVARMLGLCILRELAQLGSDEETVTALSFDLRWQHALGLSADEDAYLSRRSLVDFRRRLAIHDPEGMLLEGLFARIGEAAIEDLGLSISTQRVDSTFVRSNMKVRGRLALLREALRVFVEHVIKEGREAALLDGLLQFAQEGAQGWDREASKRGCSDEGLLDTGAVMVEVVDAFADDPLAQSVSYQHLKRLVGEHFSWEPAETAPAVASGDVETLSVPPDDCGGDSPEPCGGMNTSARAERYAARRAAKATRKKRKRARKQARKQRRVARCTGCGVLVLEPAASSDSLQSPYDPDARRGNKGTGYLVHVNETAGNAGRPEIITDVVIRPANAPDQLEAPQLFSRLAARQALPQRCLADAGYATPDAFEEADRRGVELYSPAHRGTVRAEVMSREAFSFDADGLVVHCPEGHRPLRHHWRPADRRTELTAYFDRERCDRCSRRRQCPVQDASRSQTRLAIGVGLRLRDRTYERRRDEGWQKRYAQRSGIEATNSELKRAHAMDRLPVRGIVRMRHRILFKVSACNIKRWSRAYFAHGEPAPQPALQVQCAAHRPAATEVPTTRKDAVPASLTSTTFLLRLVLLTALMMAISTRRRRRLPG